MPRKGKKGKLLVADDKTVSLKDLERSIRKLLQHINTILYNTTVQNQQLVRDLHTWWKRKKQKSHSSFKKMKHIRINPFWEVGKIFTRKNFFKCWEKRLKDNTRRWKDLLCSRILAKQKYCIKQLQMNKENSFCKAHNGILFNHEEEGSYAVCINISEAHKRGVICKSEWSSQRGWGCWRVIGAKYEQCKKLQMY